MLNQEMKDLTLNILSLAKKGLETKIHIFSQVSEKAIVSYYEGIKKPCFFQKKFITVFFKQHTVLHVCCEYIPT